MKDIQRRYVYCTLGSIPVHITNKNVPSFCHICQTIYLLNNIAFFPCPLCRRMAKKCFQSLLDLLVDCLFKDGWNSSEIVKWKGLVQQQKKETEKSERKKKESRYSTAKILKLPIEVVAEEINQHCNERLYILIAQFSTQLLQHIIRCCCSHIPLCHHNLSLFPPAQELANFFLLYWIKGKKNRSSKSFSPFCLSSTSIFFFPPHLGENNRKSDFDRGRASKQANSSEQEIEREPNSPLNDLIVCRSFFDLSSQSSLCLLFSFFPDSAATASTTTKKERI